MKNCYSENIKVKYSEIDYVKRLKPSAILNYLQDLASYNAESLGFGYSYVTSHNLAWFLLKYHMEFYDYPQNIHNLTVKTEPRGCHKLFAYRDFEICDEEKIFARIASIWAVADIDTRTLVPAQKALNNEKMAEFKKREDDLNFSKIQIPSKIDYEKTFEVRYDDIDVNMHANNCNYIIWAFEPLPIEFYNNHKLKTLDMQFKKEIKYGEKVVSQIEKTSPNTTLHLLKNSMTGEDLCLVRAVWD